MFLIFVIGVALVIFLAWLFKEDSKQQQERAEQVKREEWKREREEREKAYDAAMASALAELESKCKKSNAKKVRRKKSCQISLTESSCMAMPRQATPIKRIQNKR